MQVETVTMPPSNARLVRTAPTLELRDFLAIYTHLAGEQRG